jgi:sirohydrochlorin ferrochelatase
MICNAAGFYAILPLPFRGRQRVSTGIIVFAHGSRIEPANQAVRAVAAELARAGPYQHVVAAFLELGQPDLETAVIELSGRGVRRMVVIPYFLTLGMHLERDLPRIVERISNNHSHLEISVSPPLDGHPGLLQVLKDRAREALS